ncbi:MAG: sigma-70 family RNA polymerase sigma factor [Bacteroidales bacterium]|nr:MAG: sigma-70 family RNA polymerase sigma factor [Bacteroidales bacterium]
MAKRESHDFINGIKNRDNKILQVIYKEHFSLIKSFILKNNGNIDDARDVFQEAIIVIFRYAKRDDFKIDCSFETFLYSISRTIWLNNLRNKKIRTNKIDDIREYIAFNASDNEQIEESTEFKLYQKHFEKLSDECKKLMQLFYDKVPYKEIAKIMNYKSVGIVKKKKYKCKEALLKSIRNDPEFKLLNEQKHKKGTSH